MSTASVPRHGAHAIESLKHKLPPLGTLGPFLALLAACVFFATQTDTFLSGGNLSLVLQQVMVVGVIAIGQTLIDLPDAMTWLGTTFGIGSTQVAFGTVLMLLLYGIVWFALKETARGRHVYAVGNNKEATRLTGIPTQRVLLGVYVLAGVFYGVASLLSVSRTGVGDPNAGQTENLDAITAVVLGGTSLFGGRGSVLGSLVGALIVGVFRNGLTLMGVSSIYQVLITGILVILAVAVDQLARRRQI